jgi:hypothetical protein
MLAAKNSRKRIEARAGGSNKRRYAGAVPANARRCRDWHRQIIITYIAVWLRQQGQGGANLPYASPSVMSAQCGRLNFAVSMSRTSVITFVLIGFAILWTNADAATRKLECREWIDHRYNGLYEFNYDEASKTFSANYREEMPANRLFGSKVKTWDIAYYRTPHLIVVGLDYDEWTTPVHVISLDFAKVEMFTYGMGGALEDLKLMSVVERRCERTD